MTSLGSSLPGIISFLGITTGYIVTRWFVTDSYKTRHLVTWGKIVTLAYIVIAISVQFFANLSNTTKICGTRQTKQALIYTLVPNFFMFTILFALLTLIPGWKIPFADTFGYSVLKLMGINDLLRKMIKTPAEMDAAAMKEAVQEKKGIQKGGGNSQYLKDKERLAWCAKSETPQKGGGKDPDSTSQVLLAAGKKTEEAMKRSADKKESQTQLKEILRYVKEDPSLMVNQITPGNWDRWMKETALPKLFKDEYKVSKNNPDIERLYNLISLRDLIAEYIWLILGGLLVITTQTNAIFSITCKTGTKNVQTEQKIQNKWDDLNNKKIQEKNQPNFYTRE